MRKKTAIITGGSRGVGFSIAKSLFDHGFNVILVARDEKTLKISAAQIDKSVTVIPCDLTNLSEVSKINKVLIKQRTSVDVLVNCAGKWHDDQKMFHGRPLDEISSDEIVDVLSVGLIGAMLMSKIVLPGMKRKKSGKIINIGCTFKSSDEATGWLHYYAANKAVEDFTKGLASEVRQWNIQVNCLAPRYVASEALLKFLPQEADIALKPDEVASLAAWLISDAADHLTGQVINIWNKEDR